MYGHYTSNVYDKIKNPFVQDWVTYTRINNELLRLKRELGTGLVMLDGFIWYVSKFHSEK